MADNRAGTALYLVALIHNLSWHFKFANRCQKKKGYYQLPPSQFRSTGRKKWYILSMWFPLFSRLYAIPTMYFTKGYFFLLYCVPQKTMLPIDSTKDILGVISNESGKQ